jgi:hypothetical protein
MSASSEFVAFSPVTEYGNLFSDSTLSCISELVQYITMKTHLKKPYIVPINRIKEVMDTVWLNFRPNTGDIHTRYIINNDPVLTTSIRDFLNYKLNTKYINYSSDIIMQVITIIVNDILNFEDIRKQNMQYSIWNTLSGVNEVGIRSHPPIKLNLKRPNPLNFNMNF